MKNMQNTVFFYEMLKQVQHDGYHLRHDENNNRHPELVSGSIYTAPALHNLCAAARETCGQVVHQGNPCKSAEFQGCYVTDGLYISRHLYTKPLYVQHEPRL